MFSAPPLTPVVKKLIITLFAAFVLELLLANFAEIDVRLLLAFNPTHLGLLTVPQLITYVLVDSGGAMLMLINLVFMWLIISPFEQTFGKRHTLELVAAGTLGGSLAALLAGLLAPASSPLTGSFTIAYAGIAAMTQVMGAGRTMMFFGVIPMTSRQLLLVLVGFAVLNFLESKNYLVLAASLGSMLAGAGYVRYMSRRPRPSPPKRPGSSRLRVLRGGGGGGGGGGGNGDSDRPKWLN